MEATLNLPIITVSSRAYPDEEGIMIELFIGDQEEASSDALVAWGDLIDELVGETDLTAHAEVKNLLSIADAMEEAARDLRAQVASEVPAWMMCDF